MKITILLMSAGLFAGTISAQLPRIILQGSGAPEVFTSVDSAVAAAQPNDKLYFSGGTFTTGDAGLLIDKPLHFIGAGISPDSTNVTAITMLRTQDGDFVLTTGAGGSSFTGIHFYPHNGTSFSGKIFRFGTTVDNDAPQNVVFERCAFQCYVALGKRTSGNSADPSYPGSSSSFNECIFYGEVNGSGRTSTNFTKCYFAGVVADFIPIGLFIDHCIMRQNIFNSDGFLVKNSVILHANWGSYQSTGTMNNCLLVGNSAGAGSGSYVPATNTIYGQDLESIFVSDADNTFQWSDDFNLASGSPGIGAADDDTDIGIYGTDSPFKAGGVPYNPHFQQATIAPSTNSNGELPVNIRVAAQSH